MMTVHKLSAGVDGGYSYLTRQVASADQRRACGALADHYERGTHATLHALESGSELAYVIAEKASGTYARSAGVCNLRAVCTEAAASPTRYGVLRSSRRRGWRQLMSAVPAR